MNRARRGEGERSLQLRRLWYQSGSVSGMLIATASKILRRLLMLLVQSLMLAHRGDLLSDGWHVAIIYRYIRGIFLGPRIPRKMRNKPAIPACISPRDYPFNPSASRTIIYNNNSLFLTLNTPAAFGVCVEGYLQVNYCAREVESFGKRRNMMNSACLIFKCFQRIFANL